MKNFINNTMKECKEVMKQEWKREFGEKGFIETVKDDIKNNSRLQYSINKLKGNVKNNIDFINNKISEPSKSESKTIEDQINKLYKSIECDKIAIKESKSDEEIELNKRLLKIHEERLAALEKIWFFEE